MKSSIFKWLLFILISGFSCHSQAAEETSKNLRSLREEEEKMRIKALENPTPENIAKCKEMTKECMDAAEKFAVKYREEQKKQ